MNNLLIIIVTGIFTYLIIDTVINRVCFFIATHFSDSIIRKNLRQFGSPIVSTIAIICIAAILDSRLKLTSTENFVACAYFTLISIVIWNTALAKPSRDSDKDSGSLPDDLVKPNTALEKPEMDSFDDSGSLLDDLAKYNMPIAACKIQKTMSGGVYPKEIVEALNLFTSFPCPETALILVKTPKDVESASPLLGFIATSDPYRFINSRQVEKGNHKLPLDEETSEFVEAAEKCLRDVDLIYDNLKHKFSAGEVSIGFHRMRDQRFVLERISMLGLEPSIFEDKRQWLREKFMTNKSCWRICMDLICIWGVDSSIAEEKFWQANGHEVDAEWHLYSEMQILLNHDANEFAKFLKTLNIDE